MAIRTPTRPTWTAWRHRASDSTIVTVSMGSVPLPVPHYGPVSCPPNTASTLRCPISGNGILKISMRWPDCARCPKHLKDNGYKTALIGKFHMGSPYTPQHGIDHWIPDEHGHTTDFWDAHYVEDGQTHHYDGHATDLWTEKAVDFLHDNTDGRPTFLHVPVL